MAHIRNMRRCAAALVCVSLGILAGPVVLAPGAAATAPSPIAPFPAPNVDFVGFGNGSGLGMGQWGAFGYAALDHESYQWILAHYYGGTALSSSDNLVSTDPTISVDLNENDGDPVVVTSQSAFSFGGETFLGGQAVRAVLSQGTWTLAQAAGCSSTKWTPVASNVVRSRRRAVLGAALCNLEPGADDLRARRRRSCGPRDRRGVRLARWRGHAEHASRSRNTSEVSSPPKCRGRGGSSEAVRGPLRATRGASRRSRRRPSRRGPTPQPSSLRAAGHHMRLRATPTASRTRAWRTRAQC